MCRGGAVERRPQKSAGPMVGPALSKGWLATAYSPTPSRAQYHRRCRA